jgi:hypothetical protein
VDSIRNYISGVKTLHLLLSYNIDHINSYLLNLSLRGFNRLHPRSVNRAEPITLHILRSIHAFSDFSDQDNIVYWCLFLFAFFLVARKSNLVPTNSSDIVKGIYSNTTCIKYFGNYILVHFNWSKTIQFAVEELCQVYAYELKFHRQNDLFYSLKDGSYVSYYLFQKKLLLCIENIGLNPDLFSSHSYKRVLLH